MINVTSLGKFKNTIFLHEKAGREPEILGTSLIYGDLSGICDLRPLTFVCMCVCILSRAIRTEKSIELLHKTFFSMNAICFLCVCSCFENNKQLNNNNVINNILPSHFFNKNNCSFFHLILLLFLSY